MSPPASHEAVIPRVRWLLLLPPCLPGVLTLWIGWRCDLFGHEPGSAPAMQGLHAHARQQAQQLYAAGSVALLGGLLMAAFVGWKILRPPPPSAEDGKDILDRR